MKNRRKGNETTDNGRCASFLGSDPRLTEIQWTNAAVRRTRTDAIDPTTGLATRASFLRSLDQMMSAQQTAVVVIDLDGFSQINSVCGQEAGDRVLLDVGLAISRRVRVTDLVGRLGADSYGVAVPGLTRAQVEEIANRLLSEIRLVRPPSDPMTVGVLRIRIHASAGATLSLPGECAGAVVDRATDALIHARTTNTGHADIAA